MHIIGSITYELEPIFLFWKSFTFAWYKIDPMMYAYIFQQSRYFRSLCTQPSGQSSDCGSTGFWRRRRYCSFLIAPSHNWSLPIPCHLKHPEHIKIYRMFEGLLLMNLSLLLVVRASNELMLRMLMIKGRFILEYCLKKRTDWLVNAFASIASLKFNLTYLCMSRVQE